MALFLPKKYEIQDPAGLSSGTVVDYLDQSFLPMGVAPLGVLKSILRSAWKGFCYCSTIFSLNPKLKYGRLADTSG